MRRGHEIQVQACVMRRLLKPSPPSSSKLALTPKTIGWTRRVSASVPRVRTNPHSPVLSPPLWERASPDLNTTRRGRGVNSDVASTQGGALTHWPWATIRRPFRAENRLGVRLSAVPCVQRKRYGTRSVHRRRGAFCRTYSAVSQLLLPSRRAKASRAAVRLGSIARASRN
jgi:hypothetical protein